ncbi:MAG: glycoside hydrolase family 3 C-terminal domain-containing protein, partial [Melioribacteraceae bacterium]|nr:glycoside hydrolase family 3 C-terminal domain-containing protein [Melioribacteraceae bacterium]
MRKAILIIAVAIIYQINYSNIFAQEISMQEKIESLIKKMTLEEKIGMLHASSSFTSGGVERLGVPELIMSDGPHGVRREHGRDWEADETDEDFATYLPTGITLASTWNRELGYVYGTVLGSEANARNKDVILGPGVNIIRSPLNGRNFEYMSEDPYLTAEMSIGYIKGVQEQEVAACIKHYVANNQETLRGSIDAVVSERALREIYLPAFKAAVERADVWSIMTAYNKVNGIFCSESDFLLNQILKQEYGFDGALISDWGAVHSTKETLMHGVDIEMGTELNMLPNADYTKFFLADSAYEAVKKGEVDEKFVDEKIRSILRLMFRVKKFDERVKREMNTPEHQALALKVAEEGIILLKNENILPIQKKVKKIAVIGNNAIRKHTQYSIQGGSSQVKALYEKTPLEGIQNVAGKDYEISFATGYLTTRENKADEKLVAEAVALAKESDLVVFVGGWVHGYDDSNWGEGTFDAESLDKLNLDLLFEQDKLIEKLAEANPNIVSVIFGGSSAKFGKWSDVSKALLHVWYPGMEGGTAIANILLGIVNPSGKLPVSFAKDYLDYPSHVLGEYPGNETTVNYNEDIFVGYRYFDTFDKLVVYPFGHGLSYTKFDYGKINIPSIDYSKSDKIKFSINITNSGEFNGAEIVQVYVSDKESSLRRPEKELKSFEKIFLNKGETKT